MKKFKAVMALLLVVLLAAACGQKPAGTTAAPAGSTAAPQTTQSSGGETTSDKDAIHFIYSSAAAVNGAWTPGEEMFCKLVNERTNGKYVLDYYPLDQLTSGNQTKALEMVQMGVTDFDCRAGMFYTNIDDKWNSMLLPWAFPNYETVDKFLLGEGGQKLAEGINSSGLVFLAYGENGYRQLTNNKRPIKAPEDLKGLKLRVAAMNMLFDLFNCFGTNGTNMNITEVFTALQQNTVDGQENPLDVINSFKFQQVQKYLTLWNCCYDPIVLVVNDKTWEKFSDDEKKIIKEAAEEAMAYQREFSRKRTEELIASLEKEMQVDRLTDAEVAAFRKAAQPVYDKWAPVIGQDLMDLIDAANK